MKLVFKALMSVCLIASLSLLSACDWSSGGDGGDFNTSRGAGINVNWSGVYRGMKSGGDVAGAATSVGNVKTLVINQAGNAVEVTDSNGLNYNGRVGSPGAISTPVDGAFSAGAELATSQINFSGNGVEFVGIVHAVTVTEIQGDQTIITRNDGFDQSDTDTRDVTVTQNADGSTTVGNTSEVTTGFEGTQEVNDGQIIETDVNTQTSTTDSTATIGGSRDETLTDVETRTDTSSEAVDQVVEDTFILTENNTQFRLEGTWIDSAGTFSVDALSRGNGGAIVTTQPVN